MSTKIPVGVLGATGAVGQKFIKLLENHPWFEVTEVAASERNSGKQYGDAVSWKQVTPVPKNVRTLEIRPCTPELKCRVVFSGLDASVAGDIEGAFAAAGHIVITNARNFRMDPLVPLLIPEVNADPLKLIGEQRRSRLEPRGSRHCLRWVAAHARIEPAGHAAHPPGQNSRAQTCSSEHCRPPSSRPRP